MERTESFSRGYDHGNYGNAYESQDWDSWIEDQETPEGLDAGQYWAGMLLGFFSSYEIHEIDCEVSDQVEELRAEYDVDLD